MLALTFPETKAFMSRLLLSPIFDRFLLVEAQISTGVTISIDGHFLKDFYTEEELEEKEYADSSFSYWEHLRPVCLNLIKGKKTPLGFKFVFRLNSSNTAKLLSQAGLPFSPADVAGLYLNLRYDQGKLTCTTATALSFFTLDKSLDGAWDSMVKRFFLKQEIAFEEA